MHRISVKDINEINLKNLLKAEAQFKCLLCNKCPAKGAAIFCMSSEESKKYYAPKGTGRNIIYPLCGRCGKTLEKNPEIIEKKLFNNLSLDRMKETFDGQARIKAGKVKT